jgi:isoprenylcysteine carboxyl methyltransferase (ICMT) family protein YpbQ
MPVILFQLVVILSIVIAGRRSRSSATAMCVIWSVFTLIMVFMPWLMILQLGVIWGTRHLMPGRTEP